MILSQTIIQLLFRVPPIVLFVRNIYPQAVQSTMPSCVSTKSSKGGTLNNIKWEIVYFSATRCDGANVHITAAH